MTRTRVLRVYHSAVVDEYRHRERLLIQRHGYDVRLVCPPSWSEGGRDVWASPDHGVPISVVPVHGPEHPILFWYALRSMRPLLRRFRPHIIDVHEEPYSVAAAAILHAARKDAPQAKCCIYTAQNIHKKYLWPTSALEKRALRQADAIYPCSTEAGEVVRAKGFTGGLHVLPLGVSPVSRREREPGPLSVGFVGRLEPYKGGDIALRAFARAQTAADQTLTYVGDGGERRHLEDLARELGINGQVRFLGAIDQDAALDEISRFDVLVVPSLTTPSWKEQFGRVVVQAMAAGTAVLASRSGSLAEVVGDAGALFEEGNVDDCAAKLRRILEDDEHRSALASAGLDRAVRNYHWERVAEGFDRMYSSMLST